MGLVSYCGFVGSLLGFNKTLMAAVFICDGMLDVRLSPLTTPLKSGDNMSLKCVWNSTG